MANNELNELSDKERTEEFSGCIGEWLIFTNHRAKSRGTDTREMDDTFFGRLAPDRWSLGTEDHRVAR